MSSRSANNAASERIVERAFPVPIIIHTTARSSFSAPRATILSASTAVIFGLLSMLHRNYRLLLGGRRSAHVDGGACHLLGEDLLLRNRFAWAALITHAFAKLRARTYPTKARGFVSHKLSRPRLTSANLLHAGLSEEFDAKRLWPPIWKSFYHRLSA